MAESGTNHGLHEIVPDFIWVNIKFGCWILFFLQVLSLDSLRRLVIGQLHSG